MRAVIYARYSSEKQSEQSIEGQMHVCEDYCKRNNIDIFDKYIDRATTAKTDRRPDFQRMIKDSEKRQFDAIVVYKLDRFSRNRYDSATYKAKLKKFGVSVISATENISNNPEGVLLESVLEGMAEFYSKELAQKVTRGMRESALKCQTTGGSIPMGFITDPNKKLVPDPIYAPIVKRAFEMYAEGYTVKEICDVFNREGYKTKRGTPFGPNSFKSTWGNKKYIGVYKYDDIEIPGGMPAIIDKPTFDKVQKRLVMNKKAPARGKATTDYLLSTKLFCGHCGKLMIGESANKNGHRYYYYTCSERRRKHTCKKKPIQKDLIEDLVIKDTVEYILNEETICEIAEVAAEQLQKERNDNTVVLALKSRFKEIEKSIGNLAKAIEQGVISETITKRISDLEKERKDTLLQIDKENKTMPALTKEEIFFFLQTFLDGDTNDSEYRKRLINTLVNAVFVYDDSDGGEHGIKLVITYNVSKDNTHTVNISDLSRCGLPNLVFIVKKAF